ESRRKLQEIRQCFSRQPDESLLLWLYRCGLTGANKHVFLDSNEAKQLGPLARDVAIDSRIWTRTGTLSLWRRLVSSVKEAYPCEGDVMVYRDRWSTRLEGVNYLAELTMLDVLYERSWNKPYLDNPDQACCTLGIWEEFEKSAPPLYARALSEITWNRSLKVQKLMAYIWDYRLKPSPLLWDSLFPVEAQPEEYEASSDDPCTICHEELGRDSCELECGHEFHRECIRTWLQEHSSTCPICRVNAELPEHPAWNSSQRYTAKAWRRSVF
ncbi:HRD1 ligase, partial [Climacteris rufus]|nr:HRD1 ligase [Climacteris rufus]